MRTHSSSSRPLLRRPDDTGEDKELTAFLNAQVATILSASHEPLGDLPAATEACGRRSQPR